jgi:DNA replication protein DnaC
VLLIGSDRRRQDLHRAGRGTACVRQRHSVLYMTVTTWLENVALARSSGTYLRYRDKLAKPDLMILDDMGMRKLSSTEAQDLCEILEERSIGKVVGFHHAAAPGPLG